MTDDTGQSSTPPPAPEGFHAEWDEANGQWVLQPDPEKTIEDAPPAPREPEVPAPPPTAPAGTPVEGGWFERLADAKKMLDAGLIAEAEYDATKSQILSSLNTGTKMTTEVHQENLSVSQAESVDDPGTKLPGYIEAVRKIAEAQQSQSERLVLSALGFSSLPPEIGQLTRLQSLELDNNQLTSLPPEIGQLRNLQELGPRDNQLTTLPPEIGQLTKLKILNLDGNQLDLASHELAARLEARGVRVVGCEQPPPRAVAPTLTLE